MKALGALVALGLVACVELQTTAPVAAPSLPSPPPLATVARPAPANALDVRDDGAAFLAYYDAAKSEAPAARVTRFEREIEPQFPAYWAYVRAGAARNGSTFAARLNREVDAFPALEEEYRRIAPGLRATLDGSLTRFREHFPDFAPTVHVRILDGLGRMDGGTRVLDGQFYLLFGVDMIARHHRGQDLAPLFAHELFHVYHAQLHGEDGRSTKLVESVKEEAEERTEPLYRSLWDEGLATYVSEVLSPGATPPSLMLDTPTGLIAACEKNRAFLIEDLRQHLDARDPETYAAYFFGGPVDGRRPARAGYYLGYLVAKTLAARRPLPELVALEGEPLRRAIDSTLAYLAAP